MMLTRENRVTRTKIFPTVTLSTASPTWTCPWSDLGLHGERPAMVSRISWFGIYL